MQTLIVGTGAMACLFAARLARTGVVVTMLGSWPEGLSALRTNGVRFLDLNGDEQCYPVQVMDEAKHGVHVSEALILVKSWQTARVAAQLVRCLDGSGIALTLQNGLGNYETLLGALGAERVALGVTTMAARLIEPGYVQQTGEGKVTLGLHPKLTHLREVMTKSGFQVESSADPQSLLWGKLVINASINPLSAILGITNGGLLAQADIRELLHEIATETEFIAYHKGIRLPYPDPIDMVEQVATNTAANRSSMLMDILNGRPTEIDAINGAIVQAGEEAGVPTPVNRVLWQLVRGLDSLSGRNKNESR
jgi:2-dehydropantoate 2-reductase